MHVVKKHVDWRSLSKIELREYIKEEELEQSTQRLELRHQIQPQTERHEMIEMEEADFDA